MRKGLKVKLFADLFRIIVEPRIHQALMCLPMLALHGDDKDVQQYKDQIDAVCKRLTIGIEGKSLG
tara:strand:- start:2231 stop:2428 length:198 start_codon:yes stop_codon:yes gene_type:complete